MTAEYLQQWTRLFDGVRLATADERRRARTSRADAGALLVTTTHWRFDVVDDKACSSATSRSGRSVNGGRIDDQSAVTTRSS